MRGDFTPSVILPYKFSLSHQAKNLRNDERYSAVVFALFVCIKFLLYCSTVLCVEVFIPLSDKHRRNALTPLMYVLVLDCDTSMNYTNLFRISSNLEFSCTISIFTSTVFIIILFLSFLLEYNHTV